MSARSSLHVGMAMCLVAVSSTSCVPVESGPPDMSDVEAHLGMSVGYLPGGCDPVGIGGDGRAGLLEAAFGCPGDVQLLVQRFASEVVDDLPSDAGSREGWIEWTDDSTGDVIRVRSDGLPSDELAEVAAAVSVAD